MKQAPPLAVGSRYVFRQMILPFAVCLVSAAHAQTISDSLFHKNVLVKDEFTPPVKQYDNSIILNSSDFTILHLNPKHQLLPYWSELILPQANDLQKQLGLFLERKLSRHFGLSLGYSMWNDLPYWTKWEGNIPINADTGWFKLGKVMFRQKAKMVDLGVTCQYIFWKKHKIEGSVAISYMHELDTYADSFIYNPSDIIILSHSIHNDYWGLVPGASYDHLFLRNKMSTGIHVRYRKYFGLYSGEIEYGLEAAFNF